MTDYQVHVHVNGHGHAVAHFPSMTEAYLYMVEASVDILHYFKEVPDIDAEWVNDEEVQFKDATGKPLATLMLIMTGSETIH